MQKQKKKLASPDKAVGPVGCVVGLGWREATATSAFLAVRVCPFDAVAHNGLLAFGQDMEAEATTGSTAVNGGNRQQRVAQP